MMAITASRPRSTAWFWALCLLLFVVFFALGSWQIKRLFWKRDLMERIAERVHAVPVNAPGPPWWSGISNDAHAYLHVRVRGVYLDGQTTRVQAATVLGSGYWLLTPLRSDDGYIYLINRGYVSANASDVAVPEMPVNVTGLLRMSEPTGGFLRDNEPIADRWFSRDVQAIAQVHNFVGRTAPYFIDADAKPEDASRTPYMIAAGEPVAGLTVIAFHNNHLVYALTWYALGLMLVGICWWVWHDEKRRRIVQEIAFDHNTANGKLG